MVEKSWTAELFLGMTSRSTGEHMRDTRMWQCLSGIRQMLKHLPAVDLDVPLIGNPLQRNLGDAVLQHIHTVRASSGGKPQHSSVACSWIVHAFRCMVGLEPVQSIIVRRAHLVASLTPGQ